MQGLDVPQSPHPAARKHVDVLLLDDDPGIGRLFSRMLHRAGYTVNCVQSAESFFEAYRALAPEVVILDVILGAHDCCPVLDFLGAQRASAPVILLSGHDHRILALTERMAKRNGLVVAGVLEKRHDPDRMIDLVRRHRVAP